MYKCITHTQTADNSVLGSQRLKGLHLDLGLEDLVGSDLLQVVHNHRRVDSLANIKYKLARKKKEGDRENKRGVQKKIVSVCSILKVQYKEEK
jgi:hypothetical protein